MVENSMLLFIELFLANCPHFLQLFEGFYLVEYFHRIPIGRS